MPEWITTVDDVASHVRARTKNHLGDEVGTFNDDTRPTEAAVQTLIDTSAGHVAIQIGTAEPCTETLAVQAQEMTALYAAMKVELTYFPEQIQNNRSPYPQLKELYDEGIGGLKAQVIEQCGVGGSDPETTDDTSLPSYGYEIPVQTLGRKTVW